MALALDKLSLKESGDGNLKTAKIDSAIDKNIKMVKLATNSFLAEMLECPVCYERYSPPVTVCENGHAVCKNCTRRLKECPTCKYPFSPFRNILLDQIIETTSFYCRNAESGCNFKDKHQELAQHEQRSCDYRNVQCFLMKDGDLCNANVVLNLYQDHLEKQHEGYIHRLFTLNSEYKTFLPTRKSAGGPSYHRVLKDGTNKLYFLESIFHDNVAKQYFISFHFIGPRAEATNYIYTIKIFESDIFKGLKYSNVCLPNIMSSQDARNHYICLVSDPEEKIFGDRCNIQYSLKIETKEIYTARRSKKSQPANWLKPESKQNS